MDTFLYVAAAGIGASVAAGVARGAWRRRDAARRDAEREAYRRRREEERLERNDMNVATIVERYFPFAKAAWRAISRTVAPGERLLGQVAALGPTEAGR